MAAGKITYPIVLKLQDPIEYGAEVIAELSIQKPRAKHFKRLSFEAPSFAEMLDVLGQLAGQPPSVIDELSWEDTQAATAILGNLLAPSPETSRRR